MNVMDVYLILNKMANDVRRASVGISLISLKKGLIIDKKPKKCHNTNVRDW